MTGSPSLPRPWYRRLLRGLVATLLLLALGSLACDLWVGLSTRGRVFTDLDQVPHRQVALVLGTAAQMADGRPNRFYLHRLETAARLYQAGKVDGILVSGDNSRRDYDEPSAMAADLMAMGIPREHITLDYAGFRTLDSVVRARRVFGLDDFLVVSQPFHAQRALFLAGAEDLHPIAFAAQDVVGAWGLKVRLREVLARTRAVLDRCLGTGPHVLGKRETVGMRTTALH